MAQGVRPAGQVALEVWNRACARAAMGAWCGGRSIRLLSPRSGQPSRRRPKLSKEDDAALELVRAAMRTLGPPPSSYRVDLVGESAIGAEGRDQAEAES